MNDYKEMSDVLHKEVAIYVAQVIICFGWTLVERLAKALSKQGRLIVAADAPSLSAPLSTVKLLSTARRRLLSSVRCGTTIPIDITIICRKYIP